MEMRLHPYMLISGNALCAALSAVIVYHAFHDWPARYARGTLSWSITVFFVAFVAASLLGLAAAIRYTRSSGRIALRIAALPIALGAGGFLLGLVKQLLTGDF